MRKKAEAKIRQAAGLLGSSDRYRIDKVRELAELVPKVYDKTILDMARLGTIKLYTGNTDDLAPFEVRNLIQHGRNVYVYFAFTTPAETE